MSLFTAPWRTAFSSQCQSCTRRLARRSLFAPPEWQIQPTSTTLPFQQQQVRGKKRSNHGPDHITVRLLRDVPGVGRKGSYVPITAGEMRNSWSPRKVATYIPLTEQRDITTRRIPVQRDVLFQADLIGIDGKDKRGRMIRRRQAALKEAERQQEGADGIVGVPRATIGGVAHGEGRGDGVVEAGTVATEGRGAEAQASLDLLAELLPPSLDFRRLVRAEDSQDIYGSVSRADVAVLIRSLLSGHEAGSRVAVQEDDISLIGGFGEDDKGDRIRALGSYTAEITIKGAQGNVSRPLNVLPQEEVPEEEAN